MKSIVAMVSVFTLMNCAWGVVPDEQSLRPVPQYPAPAVGASIVLGTNVNSGQLIFWDGDNIHLQEFAFGIGVGPNFNIIASGYVADPSFADLTPDGTTVVLGSGPDGVIYRMRPANAADFVPGDEIPAPDHFSGIALNNRLALLDRVKDDLSGSELVVVDMTARRSTESNSLSILSKPASPESMQRFIDQPPGSMPATLFIDRRTNTVYAMDAATRELRSFKAGAMITAFDNAETLDWNIDGTLIGTPGQFLNGGVGGVTRDRELIIGGALGAPATGGIQFVDAADPPMILDTLDPAGTAPPYVVIYDRADDEIIAIDPTVSPPVAYASETLIPAIPPASPCTVFDQIDAQFTLFVETFAPNETDLDLDGIPDTAMLEMIELFSCRTIDQALVLSSNSAYDINLDAFDIEPFATQLESYRQLIALLMAMSQAMQDNVRFLLNANATPLSSTYAILTCSDLENCLPEFVEDPNPFDRSTQITTRAANEPYSALGDPDGDGLTNLQEFTNVSEMGGDDVDYAIAASDPRLDGGPGLRNGSSGGCFIATAAYGTPLATEIGILRNLRDSYLLDNAAGMAFVDTYYRMSPAIAEAISRGELMGIIVRWLLVPIIALSSAVMHQPAILSAFWVILGLLLLTITQKRLRKSHE